MEDGQNGQANATPTGATGPAEPPKIPAGGLGKFLCDDDGPCKPCGTVRRHKVFERATVCQHCMVVALGRVVQVVDPSGGPQGPTGPAQPLGNPSTPNPLPPTRPRTPYAALYDVAPADDASMAARMDLLSLGLQGVHGLAVALIQMGGDEGARDAVVTVAKELLRAAFDGGEET